MVRGDAKLTLTADAILALTSVAGAAAVVFQSGLMLWLCPVVVFLLQLATLMAWLARKVRGIVYPAGLRQYILGFRIVLVAGWCISLLPGLFWGAILFHIYEPWPFSLAQGPDTAYAQAGFRKVLGVAANRDVEQIYYKGYEISDYDRYLRFRSCAADVESLAISDLRKYERGKPSSLHLNPWLSWWFTAADASRFEHWANGFKEVWMDRGTCVFYVRSWTT